MLYACVFMTGERLTRGRSTALVHILFFTFFSDKIKNAWDSKKSITDNLSDMGLSSDPNKTLPIPKAKVRTIISAYVSIDKFQIEAISLLSICVRIILVYQIIVLKE